MNTPQWQFRDSTLPGARPAEFAGHANPWTKRVAPWNRVSLAKVVLTLAVACVLLNAGRAAGAAEEPPLPWPTEPLSLADCLNRAESHNATIASAKKELEAAEGVVIQTRAILLPKLQLSGEFRATEDQSVESAATPLGTIRFGQTETWDAGVRLVQSVYEGGRMRSALRASRLTRAAAVERFQTVLLDELLRVRESYYDALLALEQIGVQQASVTLLERELQDNQRRFDAGSVPRFNVLRAEVELANAKPRLIRARNAWRNAKTSLAHLMGHRVPNDITEDIPLALSGRLETVPFELELGKALVLAQDQRSELKALRAAEQLRREGMVEARAGARPSLQAFAGYGVRRAQFGESLSDELHGWSAGVQASWNLFDGRMTRGRVVEATARHEQSEIDYENTARLISVEVRTSYSNFTEARDVLESQKKVVEQATEALRLATARAEAGSGTQLDVLSAQTALTEARTTQNLASRDYLVALARLQRSLGVETP